MRKIDNILDEVNKPLDGVDGWVRVEYWCKGNKPSLVRLDENGRLYLNGVVSNLKFTKIEHIAEYGTDGWQPIAETKVHSAKPYRWWEFKKKRHLKKTLANITEGERIKIKELGL